MKLSQAIAVVGWASTFALAWLLITDRVPAIGTTWFFFAFFTLVAFVASVGPSTQKPRI